MLLALRAQRGQPLNRDNPGQVTHLLARAAQIHQVPDDIRALEHSLDLRQNAQASTPGIYLLLNFTGVTRIREVVARAYYVGSSTHAVRIEIYNWTTASWVTLTTLNTGMDMEQWELTLLVDDDDYISGGGAARLSFYHNESGNASHDLYIDYVAIGY